MGHLKKYNKMLSKAFSIKSRSTKLAKMSWNKYISQYTTNTIAFFAPVSSNLPKGADFDMNGRKLLTPYSLFSKWCSSYLSGDWAITKVPKGFIICTADNCDVKTIQDEFKVIGSPKITKASKQTYPIGYKDSQYAALAGDLGYVLKIPKKMKGVG
jgi:hypothetical protein